MLSLLILSSCEEDIVPQLETAEPQIVIDAWINNTPTSQYIRITETVPYFDSLSYAGVKNAIVYIEDNTDNTRYDFDEISPGVYAWVPSTARPQLGTIQNSYDLNVEIGGGIYTATSTLNRVPKVDSIVFSYKSESLYPDGYYAQFYATDLIGPGDTYWIKAYKNGQFLNKANELNLAFTVHVALRKQAVSKTVEEPIATGTLQTTLAAPARAVCRIPRGRIGAAALAIVVTEQCAAGAAAGPVTASTIPIPGRQCAVQLRPGQNVVAVRTVAPAINNLAFFIQGCFFAEIVIPVQFVNIIGDDNAHGIMPGTRADAIASIDCYLIILSLSAQISTPGTVSGANGRSQGLAISVGAGQAAQISAITGNAAGNEKPHGKIVLGD